VVGLAEASGGVDFRPGTCGVVSDVKGGGKSNVVGELGWGVGKIIGGSRGGRRGGKWGIMGREEKGSSKGAEATQMVNGEGYQGNMVGVQGVDYSLCG
jgi:hypothetical protein